MEILDFKKSVDVSICKVDENLGLVFGFAIVSKVNGEPYYDLQGHHITDNAMMKATTDYMINRRSCKDMHKGDILPGSVVHSFPLTDEVKKAFNIQCDKSGWMIAMHPGDEEIFNKFKSGEYTGFSIGGHINDAEPA